MGDESWWFVLYVRKLLIKKFRSFLFLFFAVQFSTAYEASSIWNVMIAPPSTLMGVDTHNNISLFHIHLSRFEE
jgi:hypothetical protein